MKAYRQPARAKSLLASTAGILALALTAPAFAQDSGQASEPTDEDIVVTGTLIRGIAPVGTNVVAVDEQAIRASGAVSTNDVLARVPQITNNFNRVAISTDGSGGITVSRPNIRNLGASGANTTLVLVDGHRMVGTGLLQTTPDPDVVPPSLIERVEVVPDGGSSIYGSDAIGGVVNLITRKRFDGVEVSGRYGFADDYWQYDLNATAGKDWGSGSLYAAYVFTKHDAIFGRERDYVRQITPSNLCAPGTITINANSPAQQTYRVSDLTPGAAQCDTSDEASFVPAERRHSVFAGLNQDLNDAITIDLRAFFTNRVTTTFVDQFRSTGTITSANPFFRPVGGATTQNIGFSYAPVFGPNNRVRTELSEWGVTPSLTADLGGGWQLRALGNYGRSFTSNQKPILFEDDQTAALAGTTTATALNPYDLTQTSPAVLASLRTREDYGQAKQELANGRVVLDGSAFSLPGGDVRLAVGAEVVWEDYRVAQSSNHPIGDFASLYRGQASRTVTALFGEVAIPIFGADNAIGGFQSLTLSASGRYDHYSDVGSTFNPKFGVTWKPVDWLSLRGNYGTSFNAPSLADTGAAQVATSIAPLAILGGNLFGASLINPASPPSPFGLDPIILVLGGNKDLRPQKADTWSLGFDFKPSFIEGLNVSATYYNVKFTDQISIAFGSNLFAPGMDAFVLTRPTLAEAQARVGTAPTTGLIFTGLGFAPVTSVEQAYAGPIAPYLLYDLRRNNLGSVKTDGVDFSASYFLPTGFGSINLSAAGNYVLNRKVRTVAGGPERNALATDLGRFNLTAGIGATVGNFTAQATLYHSAGYDLGIPLGGQTKVGAYDTVDLFFAYDVKGEGLLRDLSFTLNLNNVFDDNPPFINTGNGYTNGSTLGRLVQFGVRKKF